MYVKKNSLNLLILSSPKSYYGRGKEIIIDFEDVQLVTQSFIHALISDPIRECGINVLDLIIFKNCNSNIKAIIDVVVDYMQDTI